MLINFGSTGTNVNCAIVFDSSENANYGFLNRNITVQGLDYKGRVDFPYGANWIKYYCDEANNKINIPNSVTSLFNSFASCAYMNQNLHIPDSVTNMVNTFYGCRRLNQNIQIPNGVTNLYWAFNGCYDLNQNIRIPNSVTSMIGAFNGCSNLNQNIQIPNGVTNTEWAFASCSNLNQNIYIPDSVTNCWFMFKYTSNISDITVADNKAVNTFLGAFSRYSRIANNASFNVWTGPNTASNMILSNIITPSNGSNISAYQIRPTWETITNGYYNAQYNFYIYTNAFN